MGTVVYLLSPTKEDSFVCVYLEAHTSDRLLAVQFRGGQADDVLVS